MVDDSSGNLIFRDYLGRQVRLTDTQLRHIYEEHSDMLGMEWAIAPTLAEPEATLPSVTDPETVLEFFRWFPETTRGEKYVRVVVKYMQDDAFVLTAHLTRRIPKRGG